jgi:23S rRNA (uridine2552-2'-O)-methyltransferase
VKPRAQHPASFRSRSALKLLEIQDAHGVHTAPWVCTVLDLGAAPGGWSQAVANVFGFGEDADADDGADGHQQLLEPPSTSPHGPDVRTIIALDLLPIQSITGVHTLQADFLSSSTTTALVSLLQKSNAHVDILLSDMSGNHTGNRAADVEDALDLAKAVFVFSRTYLAPASISKNHPGGTLVYVVSRERRDTGLMATQHDMLRASAPRRLT